MANLIPKIEFDVGPTIIDFSLPPEGFDNEGRTSEVAAKVSEMQSGLQQISINHVKDKFDIKFKWIDKSIVDAVESFIINWAALNNTFKYFPDKDEATFYECYIDKRSLRFRPKRLNTNNKYEFKLSFYRLK